MDPLKFCPDCQEVYQNPRLLRCLHPLCEQSILDMLKDAQDKGATPKCPVCGDEAGITDLVELPPLGLVETETYDAYIVQECMVCDKAGDQHCQTCNIHMCTAHAAEHLGTKNKSNHQMFPTTVRKKTIYECRMHARQEFSQFCMTCLEPVCVACLTMDRHKTHTVVPLDKAFQKLHDTVSNFPDVVEYFDQFEKQVMSMFSSIIDKLQKRREELLNEGRAQLLAGLPEDMTLDVMRQQVANVHQWKMMAQRKVDEPLVFLHIYPFLMRRMCTLSRCDDKSDVVVVNTPSFVPLDEDMQRLINLPTHNLGKVVSIQKRQRFDSSVEVRVDWKSISKPSLSIPQADRHLLGIAALDDDRIVVSDASNQLLLLISLSTGDMKTIGGVRSLSYPLGVAVDKHGYIWVADRAQRKVLCFTEHGESVYTIDTTSEPHGIAFLNNGNLAVSFTTCTVNTEDCCIIVYTPAGNVVLRIQPPSQTHGEFRDVKYFDKNDELYVTASTKNRVLVFSASKGKFIRSFGMGMEWCNGLAIIPDGYVLVAEGSPGHRISVWSPTGGLVHRWSGLQHPYHLTIMPDGRVAVVDSTNKRIQIF